MARFHRLLIWQTANDVLGMTYAAVKALRGEADLRDQMKRSAISIVSNITEGSERGTDNEFRQFLIIARGSTAELQAQWHIVLTCGLIDIRAGKSSICSINAVGCSRPSSPGCRSPVADGHWLNGIPCRPAGAQSSVNSVAGNVRSQ